MCYDVNRYTLHSISIAQNNKALCLQFTVQRLMFSALLIMFIMVFPESRRKLAFIISKLNH